MLKIGKIVLYNQNSTCYNITDKTVIRKENEKMYTIYVVFECFQNKREAFIQKVKSEGIVDAVRNENGCIKYDYYYSEKNPNEILLIEAWETKKHQQIHIEQPHMARLREIKNDYIISTKLGEFNFVD